MFHVSNMCLMCDVSIYLWFCTVKINKGVSILFGSGM